MILKFFDKQKPLNKDSDLLNVACLMIHAARIDENYTEKEREIIKKTCKRNSRIGLLATEATINTKIYHNYLSRNFELVTPTINLQKKSVNRAIQLVKSGKVKEAEKIIGPAVRYLIKIRCKKIILGCTEIPIAIFAYKSFKKAKKSKIFIDPNLLLANVCMRKYKSS